MSTAKREKELAKNTIIISFGQLLPKLTTLITLPILTLYLTKAEYGTYDLINTLVSLIIPVIVLKLDMGVFRFLIEYRSDEKKRIAIISTTYLFISCTSVISAIVMFFVLRGIEPITKSLICLYFVLDIIYIATQQMVRGLSKNVIYALSSILYAVLNMCFIVLLVQVKQDGLNGLLVSMNIGAGISSAFLVVISGLWRNVRFVFSIPLLKVMLSYSWPLIPNSLSLWIMNLSDRLIVTAFLGVEMNAVYAVANKIPNLLTTIQSSFSAAWMENASLSVKDGDKEEYYSKMFDVIFCMLIGITAGLIAISPILFKLLIRGDYEDAYVQMPILVAGMMFSALSTFMGGIYAAHKKTISVGVTTAAAAISNIIINLLFVKAIGLFAASLSTFISYFLLVIFRIFDVQKFQRMQFHWKKIILYFSALVVMGGVSMIDNTYLNICNFVFACIIVFASNRNLIMKMVYGLHKKKST